MHLFPVVNRLFIAGVCAAAMLVQPVSVMAQVAPNTNSKAIALSSQPSMAAKAAARMGGGALPYQGGGASALLNQPSEMTQAELDALRKDPSSKEAKAYLLAKEARPHLSLFGASPPEPKEPDGTMGISTPPEVDTLQDVHKTYGTRYDVADDLISKEIALDMRRDAQREAALSYGARGGLSKRSYQIMERMAGYESVLDKVFDFRQLLIKAPSGLMIEPHVTGANILF